MTTKASPGSQFGTFLSYQERNADAVFGPARRPSQAGDGPDATSEAFAAAVTEMALRVVEEAPRTRLVLSIDDAAFARLDAVTAALGAPSGKLGTPVSMTLTSLGE